MIVDNISRAVARSENPEGHVILGGDNVPPLVEIGLTDLPKSGGGTAPPPGPSHLRRACLILWHSQLIVDAIMV